MDGTTMDTGSSGPALIKVADKRPERRPLLQPS